MCSDENSLTRTAHFEDTHDRVDKWLTAWSGLSRSRIKSLIDDGQISCDGRVVKKGTAKVIEEAVYKITLPPPEKDRPEPEDIPLDIVYEDDDLLVVNKVAGMTVHPAPGLYSGTLVNALLHHCAGSLSGINGVLRPGIVHRIDKDTSGLLVVAKSDAAHQGLSEQFAAHSVIREYICFVRSAPKPRKGRVETRIARSPSDRKKMAVVKERKKIVRDDGWEDDVREPIGKNAITNYEWLTGYGQEAKQAVGTPIASKVSCRLETGRTHQIRVHMGHIGCPLLGDPVYGKGRAFAGSDEILDGFDRQALHAKTIGFIHPVFGEEMSFDSDMPADMAELEKRLSRLG